MHILSIPVTAKAKPAGGIYRGRITMKGKREYGAWQVKADSSIKTSDGSPLPQNLTPYGYAFVHNCRLMSNGDLANLVGATIDTLVRIGVIHDDAPRWVNRFYTSLNRSVTDEIIIYIAMNKAEFKELLCALD